MDCFGTRIRIDASAAVRSYGNVTIQVDWNFEKAFASTMAMIVRKGVDMGNTFKGLHA